LDQQQQHRATAAQGARTGYEVTALRALGSVEPVWHALERNGDATIFQAFDTFRAWSRHVATGYGVEWLVVVVFDRTAQTPVMLLPLVVVKRGGLLVIEAADLGVCDFNGPVLARRFNPSADEMTAIWADVRRVLPEGDVVCLTKMPSVIGTAPNPLLLLKASHRIKLSNYKTPLGPRWTAERLPDKLRADLASRRRKLDKRGKVAFRTAQTEQEADTFFVAMVEQRAARFAATGRPNILDCPSHRAFYRALLTPGKETSAAVIQALTVNGKIIATGYGLVSDQGFAMIFPTFLAEGWRNYSPGMMLFVESMTWAAGRAIAFYDFTIGGEEFKMTLGAVEFPLFEHLEPLTLRGRPAVFGERLRRRLSNSPALKSLVVKARSFRNKGSP